MLASPEQPEDRGAVLRSDEHLAIRDSRCNEFVARSELVAVGGRLIAVVQLRHQVVGIVGV
jgi:hypothetical protein